MKKTLFTLEARQFILFCAMFFYPALGPYICKVLISILGLPVEVMDIFVLSVAIVGAICIGLFRNIKYFDFYFMLSISTAITVLFLSTTNEYFEITNYIQLMFAYNVFYLIGTKMESPSKLTKYAKYGALIVVTAIFLDFVYTMRTVGYLPTSNMGQAYALLPATLVLVYCFFERKSLANFVFMVAGALLLLSCGSRGPLLCTGVFVFLYFLKSYETIKVLLVGLVAIPLSLFVMSTEWFNSLIVRIMTLLESYGLSPRILEMFLDGNLSDDNGRSDIHQTLRDAIQQNPFAINGLYADRVVLNGTYAHSIFLEMLTDFGVLFGLLLFVSCCILFIMAFLYCRKEQLLIFLLLFSIGFVKLFMSSSYLNFMDAIYFAALIGISVAIIRTKDTKNPNNKDTYEDNLVM